MPQRRPTHARAQLPLLLGTLFATLSTLNALAASDAEVQGRKAYLEGNFAAAKEACQAPADAGDAGCMDVLGRNLLATKNPERDPKAAQQWLQKAVAAGNTSTMTYLALEHYSGTNLEPSADKAFALWMQAAQAGNVLAYSHMGPLFRDGRLVPRDLAKARDYFEKAGDDNSRAHLAAMLFYGEGGERQVDRAFTLWAETTQAKNPTVAKRAQADLDRARKVAEAQRADVALYLNPYHPDVRRNLEGKWVLKDMAGARQLQVCWPDHAYATVSPEASGLLPSYDARALALLQKQLADHKLSNASLGISHATNCLRNAPLVLLTREVNPTLAPNGPVPLDTQNRETVQLATVPFVAMVLDANLEARDKASEASNEAFADKATRWQLGEAASSGKPLYAAITTAIAGTTAIQGVCTLKGDAVAASAIAGLGDVWARKKYTFSGSRPPTEYESADSLFDAIVNKNSPCALVVAPAATVDKLSQAMTRDKLKHRLFADGSWTATGLAEAEARAKGYADAAQKAYAQLLNASPADIQRVIGTGLKQAADLQAAQQRASSTGYPTPLATVDQVMKFMDDEAAGKKLKKSAAAVAKDRVAAEDAARKRQEAEEAAARKKTEAATAEQKKKDEAESNTDMLSERAGVAGPIACRYAADEHVSQVARFDHKWDDVGFAGVLFDRFLKQAPRPGVLTLVSNHLALQNGFGAFRKVKVLCEYDTRTKKAGNVEIIEAN